MNGFSACNTNAVGFVRFSSFLLLLLLVDGFDFYACTISNSRVSKRSRKKNMRKLF
jgi:hypothetical protein